MKQFPSKIAIIGLGLIGGSIALGLKQHFGSGITVIGKCSTIKRSKLALRQGIIDEVLDLDAQPHGLRSVDLIILATPFGETIKLLKIIARINPRNCLIMDVGSTKEFVVNAANQIFNSNISFIGTHPMAGSELSGFENADPNLFRNKPWIVCSKNLSVISKIIEILGAKRIYMDAKQHDKLASWASHLNLVSSSIITNTIGKQKDWSLIAQTASTGFRDSTRLASSDIEMKKDIVLTNKINLLVALHKFKHEIDYFIHLLESDNNKKITNYLSKAKNIRDNWVDNYFS